MKLFQITMAALLLAAGTTWAKEHRDVKPLAGLAAGSTNTAQSNKYTDIIGNGTTASALDSRSFVLQSVTGYVYLSMPYTGVALPVGDPTVPVKITYTVEENGKIVTTTKITYLQLSISSSKMKNVVYEKFEGAISITAEVLSTDGASHNLNVPAAFTSANIKAEAIVLTRYSERLKLDVNPAPGVTLSHDASTVTTENNLLIQWTESPVAEGYELEWTYVSNQDPENASLRLLPAKIELRDYLFKNNSSRVEVKGTSLSYKIPFLYEEGYIAYRLRVIGKDYANGNTVTVKSNWTGEDGGTLLSHFPSANLYKFDGLEKNFNWQSSLSFAEEGKNKAVISYHDGSSRNRQAVTRINTDQRAIVGETMYDYNGRPNIQMLPVPVKSNDLKFRDNFNVVKDFTIYEKASTDKPSSVVGSCEPIAPFFKITTGSSRYYSGNTEFSATDILNQALIPDAKGYPYTQTQYTRDNTGRIAAQSGVGETHLIGSKKETKYLYGAPQQAEISRLFGTQVGNAAHYKKNSVIDPNGQVSISYLDLDGKVIATALAGGKPTTLDDLGNDPLRTISGELIDPVSNKLASDFTVKDFNHPFTVAETTPYTFDYSATVKSYGLQCKNGPNSSQPIYFDGVVQVDLKIVDQCGVVYLDQSRSTSKGTSGIDKSVPAFTIPNPMSLPQGEYQIIKTLRIDEVKLEEYWKSYVDSLGLKCIVTEQHVIDSAKATANLAGCNVTCSSCQTNALSLVAALESGGKGISAEEKDRILHQCDDLCRNNITCISALYSMLADVSPGGQYGEVQKQSVASPKQPSLDLNGLNSNSKVEVKEFDVPFNPTNNNDAFVPSNPDHANLTPELFDLSVFNFNNRLKKGSHIAQEVRPHWWYPIKVYFEQPSLQPNNKNNAVLTRGMDLSPAKYVEDNYYDDNSQLVYVEVILRNGQFEPELRIPATDPNVILLDAEAQRYKAPIKYLKNLKDFREIWKPVYANFLVPYHPEFPYFIECSKNEAINEFEYKLITSAKPTDGGALFMSGTTFTIIDNDPLFTAKPQYKAWMQEKFDKYKTVNTLPTATSYTMPQVALATANCTGITYSTSTCGNLATCFSGTISDATPNAWNAFKSFYLSERQKLQRQITTDIAMVGKFYNGCIGDNRFLSTQEGLVLQTPISYQVGEEKTREKCSFNALGIKLFCSNVPYTVYNTVYSIPLYDWNQTCYAYNEGLYHDKVRIFYPKTSLAPQLDVPKCSLEVASASGTVSVPEYCDSDLRDFVESMTLQAARIKFESCGLCPQATELEQLFMTLKSKNWLQDNVVHSLTCNKTNGDILLGNTLLKLISPATSSTPSGYYDVDWKGASIGTTLTGTLSRPGKTLTITLNFSAGGTFDMAKLRFCCLTVSSANSFALTAYHYPTPTSDKVEFQVTGTITEMDILSCGNIPPRCAVTQVARDATNFLSMLLKESPSLTTKTNDLVKSSVVPLDATDNRPFYEVVFRSFTGLGSFTTDPEAFSTPLSTYEPTWQATIVGDLLEGSLKYKESTVSKTIPISIEKVAGSPAFQSFKGFVNVRPSSVTPVPCAYPTPFCQSELYEADAVYTGVNGKLAYTPVKIKVKFQTATVCQPVQIKQSN